MALQGNVKQRHVGVIVTSDVSIDEIERAVIRLMLVGTSDPIVLVESGLAELEELYEHVNELPSPDYYTWSSPYFNMVFPDYVNVKSIPSLQFQYKKRKSVFDEAGE